MQLADVFCYIVLTITVTASCARIEEQNREVEEPQDGRRIRNREATLIMDFNGNHMDKIFQKPKVIYRRLSTSRFGAPNTKYGLVQSKYGSIQSKYGSARPKNRPHKAARKPGKRGRRTGKPKSTSVKYGLPESKRYSYPNKKRASTNKPKYGVPKYRPNGRPGFGHVVKMPHYSYFAPDKSSFGEPPAHMLEYQTHKHTYGEPPVDSYGAPLQTSIKDVFSTPHSFQDTTPHDDINDHKKQEPQWKQKYASSDSSYDFTKKEPSYSIFVTPTPKHIDIDAFDPVVIDKQKLQDNKFFFRKKRPFYFADSKVVNRPWKPNKQYELDDEIIVGGQYAEPPARHVPKIHQNSPMYDDDDDEDIIPALHGYVDTDNALSANNSPYLNYKHSNMAFSPQNLNDAFSIVD